MAPLAAIRMPAVPPARSSANLFSILEDERTLDDEADSRAARDRTYTSSSGTHSSDTRSSSESWSVLGDLPIDHCQSQAAPQHPTTDYSWSGFENVHRAELKSGKPQTNSRTPWRRRPQLESQTFEPLDSVREEASGLADSSCSEIRSRSPDAASGRHVQRHLPQGLLTLPSSRDNALTVANTPDCRYSPRGPSVSDCRVRSIHSTTDCEAPRRSVRISGIVPSVGIFSRAPWSFKRGRSRPLERTRGLRLQLAIAEATIYLQGPSWMSIG